MSAIMKSKGFQMIGTAKYPTFKKYFKLNSNILTLQKKCYVLTNVKFHFVEDCLLDNTYLTRGTGME